MSGVARKVVMISVGLLIVFALLVAVIPQIQDAVAEIVALADPAAPPILVTLAQLWWIPMILVMVGLIMGGGMAVRKQFRGGRSRRR